jgi:hypothetical protein
VSRDRKDRCSHTTYCFELGVNPRPQGQVGRLEQSHPCWLDGCNCDPPIPLLSSESPVITNRHLDRLLGETLASFQTQPARRELEALIKIEKREKETFPEIQT